MKCNFPYEPHATDPRRTIPYPIPVPSLHCHRKSTTANQFRFQTTFCYRCLKTQISCMICPYWPRYCLQGKPPVRRAFGVALHLDAKIADFLNRQIRPLGGTLFETSVFLIKTLQKLGVFQHGCPHFLQLGTFQYIFGKTGRQSTLKSPPS